jgi:hypothetical protein
MQVFKMNKTLFIFLTVFYFLSSGIPFVVTDQGHKPSIGSKAFKRMKQLAGNLEGEGNFGKGIEKVKANYRLTSANSKIMDSFYMGMPHDMFSVY